MSAVLSPWVHIIYYIIFSCLLVVLFFFKFIIYDCIQIRCYLFGISGLLLFVIPNVKLLTVAFD